MMNDLDCLGLRRTGHENVKDFEKILSHFCRSCNCAGIFNWQKKNVRGQVCIASRGKVKKLCMEVKAGTSADVSIRALRGSGGL